MCYDCPNVDQSGQWPGHSVSTYGVVTIHMMMSTNQSFGQVPPRSYATWSLSYVSALSDTHFELLPYPWVDRATAFLGWLNSINISMGLLATAHLVTPFLIIKERQRTVGISQKAGLIL